MSTETLHVNPKSELLSCYQRAALFEQLTDPQPKPEVQLVLNDLPAPLWIGDSACFFYRRELKGGAEYRLVDAQAGTNKAAFDHQVLASALAEALGQAVDGHNLPISMVEISLSPLQVRFMAFKKHWSFSPDNPVCTEEFPSPSEWVISPNGKKAAFTKDYNLWLRDIASGEEKPLTDDGEEFYRYAFATCAWGHDANYDCQLLWSPDSQHIMTTQRDTRQIKLTPCIDYVPMDGSMRPQLRQYQTPLPGEKHVEQYRVLSLDINTGLQQGADYRCIPTCRSGHGLRDERLAWWGKDSRLAYFVELERGECLARVVEFDTFTGVTRVVFEERSETNLHLSTSEVTPAIIKPLPDTNELIWFSERSGWAHLYLYDLKTGELKNPITQLEPPSAGATSTANGWLVRELLHVDTERREIYIQAGGRVEGRNPYYLDICRVQMDTGEITTLRSSEHDYTVLAATTMLGRSLGRSFGAEGLSGISPCGNYIVTTHSRVDEVPVTLLLDRHGSEILTVETADVSALPEGWQWPEH